MKTRKRRVDEELVGLLILLIIEMLMNFINNQINCAFHNYLSLYIGDTDNNTTFVGPHYLFVALVVTFAPSLRSDANVTTRARNKQHALHVITLLAMLHILKSTVIIVERFKNIDLLISTEICTQVIPWIFHSLNSYSTYRDRIWITQQSEPNLVG